ncbi:MAG: NADH:flavin oxidoreductase [Tatlockia sp.]|nr:NADH:flavin oxidoreductase [Tatlockia sp.]
MTYSPLNSMGTANLSVKGYEKYPNIFTPLTVNNIVIPNRIYFPPFGIDDANDDGTMSDSLEDFYMGIAQSGCGLIILGNCSVSPDSILSPRGLKMHKKSHAEGIKNIISKMEDNGTILGIQLQHYGMQATTAYSKKDLLSPSGVGCKYYGSKDPHYRAREMTPDDIEDVKNQFINAALLSADAGIKFIQLQASNGYLLHSFMSPRTNKRKDKYGGSHENRIRLLTEIIQGIKTSLKDDVILSVTIGGDDYLGSEGIRPEDYQLFMPFLKKTGLDILTVSICIAETFKYLMDRTTTTQKILHSAVRTIKGYAGSDLPIGFSGFNHVFESAEELIRNNTTDLVGMGRSLFADNDLLIKSVDGRKNDINGCLWDGNCFKDKSNPLLDKVYCCVNAKYKRPESIKYNSLD